MSDTRQRDWLVSAGYNCSDDVVRRQFSILAGTIPVMYFGFFLSAFASTAILTAAAPLHLALPIPVVFLVLASWRIPYWLRQKPAEMPVAEMRVKLRRLARFVPVASGLMITLATGLTALFGSEELCMAMVAFQTMTTLLLGSTHAMLPFGAIATFLAVQPVFYFTAAWHESILLFGLAVLSSGISISQSIMIMRQFAATVQLIESEREATESLKKVASADQIKAQFLSNMGHEIRTPLNGVLGMAELLSRSHLDPRQRGYLSAISDSGNRLLGTINNILDYSRIDAGLLVLDNAPFRLADVIEDIAHQASERAAKKQIEIIQRIDPNLPEYLCGDASRLRQVLANLVDNAVKFTETGYVLIDTSGSVTHGTACLTIRVEDTGPGIAAERLPDIFRHFAQVDTSATRRHEGTGLGLAIAARLVQLMDGEIGVESESGDGSTFWLTIPLKIHEVTDVPRHVPLDITGARVLVIDDNEINRSILAEQLKHWEFDCVAVESGPVGLAVIEHSIEMEAPVDCVILDYDMPDMNGIAIARIIRNHPLMQDLPIIILSSVDESEFADLDFDLGLSTRLTKPARSATLRSAVVEIIQAARSQTPSTSKETPAPEREPATAQPAEKDEWISLARSAMRTSTHSIDVLVAEDNEVNQIVFNQILDSTKLRYKVVPSGRKAIEAYLRQNPRVVLMDFDMPDTNGLDATRQIRKIEEKNGGHVAIIGVTAHAGDDRHAGIEAGMDSCISKPISPQVLLEAIAEALPRQEDLDAQATA